ncbi:hypothetical protein ACEWY4_001790 [Coilia grayii]|uniref:Ig-like domain-containing protein n=1 Tax=Coilia grayii TaxID=363190 RepID=A0ABD1KTX6_9TELE
MTSPTILFWTAICCIAGSLGQVTITQSASQSVRPGQTATIDCKHTPPVRCVDSATKAKYCMAWYHQRPGEGPRLLIYYVSDRASGVSSRISGSEDGSHSKFTLTIRDVQGEDAGDYYCQSRHFVSDETSVFPQ